MSANTASIPTSAPSIGNAHPSRWEDRWSSNNIGWDQGAAHPALVALLSDRQDHGEEGRAGATGGEGKGKSGNKSDELGVARSGRALVPGCGMGYDVALLASRGLDTTGLDIAPTGVQAARRYLSNIPTASSLSDKMRVEEADFFSFDPGYTFDVILDYTFLCALPPPMRQSWSSTLTRLSTPASPSSPSTPHPSALSTSASASDGGGRLITLMFPLHPPPSPSSSLPTSGPPFALTEDIYHELLDAEWELIYLQSLDRGKGEGRVRGPEGGEKLGVWRRRRREKQL